MSQLEDLYREIILDHYRSPRNRGELESPPAQKADGFNPLCGDEITVYLSLSGDGNERTIDDIKIGGQGCSISQSSASMMSDAVKGLTVAEAREVMTAFKSMMHIHENSLETDVADEAPGTIEEFQAVSGDNSDDIAQKTMMGDLGALRGVVKFPVRIKCATLSWNTLEESITNEN